MPIVAIHVTAVMSGVVGIVPVMDAPVEGRDYPGSLPELRAWFRSDDDCVDYLDCQNILDGLGKRNRGRLEATCQELLNQRGYATYTTLKRLMAAIDSDSKRPRPVTPAASTRKRVSTVTFKETVPDVYVRDASHYARGEEGK